MLSEVKKNHVWFSSRHDPTREPTTTTCTFYRTLRVPADGKTYPLPAATATFRVRAVKDLGENASPKMRERGGVVIPMYRNEALWMRVHTVGPGSRAAVKVGVGKIDAITGGEWSDRLAKHPQNYVVTPRQLWIDGCSTGSDHVEQFVAVELGSGETVEEQKTGKAEWGGMQILCAHPTKQWIESLPRSSAASSNLWTRPPTLGGGPSTPVYSRKKGPVASTKIFSAVETPPTILRRTRGYSPTSERGSSFRLLDESMLGFGLGGKIRQKIYRDDIGAHTFDQSDVGRVFVHVVSADVWTRLTGEEMPHPPYTKEQYRAAGLPWFDVGDTGMAATPAGDFAGVAPVGEPKMTEVPSVRTVSDPFKGESLDGDW